MITLSTYQVAAADVDEYGHLNHVYGLKYLEYARDVWYEKCGLWGGKPWTEGDRLGTIVLNINVNYRLECFKDEVLTVKTMPRDRGTKSYILFQQVLKADQRVAIDCASTSVIMDIVEKQTLAVPDCLMRYLPKRSS